MTWGHSRFLGDFNVMFVSRDAMAYLLSAKDFLDIEVSSHKASPA